MPEDKLPAAQMQSLDEVAQEVQNGLESVGSAAADGQGAATEESIGRAPTPLPRQKAKRDTIKRKNPVLLPGEKEEKEEEPKAPEEIVLPKHEKPVMPAPLKPRQTMQPAVLEKVFGAEFAAEEKTDTEEVLPFVRNSGAMRLPDKDSGDGDGEYDLYSFSDTEPERPGEGKPARMKRKRRRRP